VLGDGGLGMVVVVFGGGGLCKIIYRHPHTYTHTYTYNTIQYRITHARTAVQYSVRSAPEIATLFNAAHVMTVLTCLLRSAAACAAPTAVVVVCGLGCWLLVWLGGLVGR
jgi:hypothetical protein